MRKDITYAMYSLIGHNLDLSYIEIVPKFAWIFIIHIVTTEQIPKRSLYNIFDITRYWVWNEY